MSHADLQELYRHLEHTTQGDVQMAYYGQLRAKGSDHATALQEAIVYFNLTNKEWYQARMASHAAQKRP